MARAVSARRRGIEWQTVALIVGCHAAWLAGGMLYRVAPVLAVALLVLPIVLHSSLQHEAIHRHPTRSHRWNEALVFLPLGLLYPYRRYRETHLRHHRDRDLTDPHTDPESGYLSASDLRAIPAPLRALLRWNTTLLGRIVVGPAIAAGRFLLGEARLGLTAHGAVARRWRQAWALHALGLAIVLALVHFVFAMPLPAYLAAVYGAMAVLGVRGYCEHQWAERIGARSIIVERSRIALLFLHNNLHLVHHRQPQVPWYALPGAYRARRDEWLALNEGYVFSGYRAILRAFAFRAKEPLLHPAEPA